MSKSELYITKAREYCDLLHEFAEGNKEYDRLFDILDCLKLDSNYTLALHLANDKLPFGDVSWFYCYEGDTDIYRDRFNHPNDEINDVFFQCMGNLSEYQIFEHLSVERSKTGAWQAYLLSIALSQLPTWWHGAYRSDDLIFSNEDIKNKHVSFLHRLFGDRQELVLTHPEEELLPDVWFEGDTAYVRICYFNKWKGVAKRTTAVYFDQNRVIKFDRAQTEVLYPFNWGIKL